MGRRKDGNREGVVNKLDSGNMFFFPLWSWHEKLRRFYFFFLRGGGGEGGIYVQFLLLCALSCLVFQYIILILFFLHFFPE